MIGKIISISGKKLPPDVDTSPEKEKAIEVIPMNLEKPTGLEMGDFLPMKFQMMGLGGNTLGGYDSSRFSGFKNFGGPNEPNDTEVSNSILKGHESMMAALTNRGRQIEITQKLWQNKDAKTGKLLYKNLLVLFLKFGRSEKGTKFEIIFHFQFDVTQ